MILILSLPLFILHPIIGLLYLLGADQAANYLLSEAVVTTYEIGLGVAWLTSLTIATAYTLLRGRAN